MREGSTKGHESLRQFVPKHTLVCGSKISAPRCRRSTQHKQTGPSLCAVTTARSGEWVGPLVRDKGASRTVVERQGRIGQDRAVQGRVNRWVSGIPGLLLLELFAVVLFTVDTGAAVMVFFTGDEDLFLAVAVVLPAGRKVGRGGRVRRRDLTTFPPGLVVGEVEVELLVGSSAGAGLARLLLVVVAIRRGEDAEGDGDSRFKIQVDCLVWARRVVSLSTS